MDENVQITTENYPEQFIEITKQYLDFLRQYSQGSSSDMVFEGLRETGEQLYDLIERVNSEIKFIEGVSEKMEQGSDNDGADVIIPQGELEIRMRC